MITSETYRFTDFDDPSIVRAIFLNANNTICVVILNQEDKIEIWGKILGSLNVPKRVCGDDDEALVTVSLILTNVEDDIASRMLTLVANIRHEEFDYLSLRS